MHNGLATARTLLIQAVRSSFVKAFSMLERIVELSVLAAVMVPTTATAVSALSLGSSTLNLSLFLGTFYRHRIKVFKYGKLRVISLKVE